MSKDITPEVHKELRQRINQTREDISIMAKKIVQQLNLKK